MEKYELFLFVKIRLGRLLTMSRTSVEVGALLNSYNAMF